MKAILIRHTSVDVPKGVCYGQTDVPLAPSFPTEALRVKESLKQYRFDKVSIAVPCQGVWSWLVSAGMRMQSKTTV